MAFMWKLASPSMSFGIPVRNAMTARLVKFLGGAPDGTPWRIGRARYSTGLRFEERFGTLRDRKEKTAFKRFVQRTFGESLVANERSEHFPELIGRRG